MTKKATKFLSLKETYDAEVAYYIKEIAYYIKEVAYYNEEKHYIGIKFYEKEHTGSSGIAKYR